MRDTWSESSDESEWVPPSRKKRKTPGDKKFTQEAHTK